MPTQISTAPVHLRLDGLVPDVEAALHEPLIREIDELKRTRNAVVLSHNYMTPDIFHGIADVRGDSLQLARLAAETDAEVIVLAGVHFMAETAKIVNPDKTVLIPHQKAGCSLAESITGADVRLLKQRYPGVPVVTYVNTSADVKAESDICCTSSNAVAIVESLNTDRVIFLPDGISRPMGSVPDRCRGNSLARQLRGPRAFHGRRIARLPDPLSRYSDHRAPGVPAGRAGRSGLRRKHIGNDQLGQRGNTDPGGDGHRMLDE